MAQAGQTKIGHGVDRRQSQMPDSAWRPAAPAKGCGAGLNRLRGSDSSDEVPSALPDRPTMSNIRRATMQQPPPSHIRQTISSDGSRRHTVVMPLLAFFSRQGRHNSTSLSFRSGSLLLPPQRKMPMENTYRMEPDASFPQGKARTIMAEALEGRLQGKEYKASSMAYESRILSDTIKERVKSITPPRYKLVCWVTIGQKGQADIRIASRGLWDKDCDTFTQEVFENASLYAVAILYAVYQE